jgi:hypothetical protein
MTAAKTEIGNLVTSEEDIKTFESAASAGTAISSLMSSVGSMSDSLNALNAEQDGSGTFWDTTVLNSLVKGLPSFFVSYNSITKVVRESKITTLDENKLQSLSDASTSLDQILSVVDTTTSVGQALSKVANPEDVSKNLNNALSSMATLTSADTIGKMSTFSGVDLTESISGAESMMEYLAIVQDVTDSVASMRNVEPPEIITPKTAENEAHSSINSAVEASKKKFVEIQSSITDNASKRQSEEISKLSQKLDSLISLMQQNNRDNSEVIDVLEDVSKVI